MMIKMNFSLWTTQRILRIDPLEQAEQDLTKREINGLQSDLIYSEKDNKDARNKKDYAKKPIKRRQKLMMNLKTAVLLLVQKCYVDRDAITHPQELHIRAIAISWIRVVLDQLPEKE